MKNTMYKNPANCPENYRWNAATQHPLGHFPGFDFQVYPLLLHVPATRIEPLLTYPFVYVAGLDQ